MVVGSMLNVSWHHMTQVLGEKFVLPTFCTTSPTWFTQGEREGGSVG
jgi:hypothetical protein